MPLPRNPPHRVKENSTKEDHEPATHEPVMVLLNDRVEQQGTVPLHERVVPLALPKINGNTALVRKRFLNTQGTLRQERMEHLRHLRRGDGAIRSHHAPHQYH